MSEALRRILIVDDEPEILEMLKAYFSDKRYDVMTAQQGADAVMIAGFQRPDAMLLDILMPGMDGVKVLRAIRTMDSSIPVIMVTANTDEKIGRDTLVMGAFDYIRKPFDFNVLERAVETAVAAGASSSWSAFRADGSASRLRPVTAAQVAARFPTARRTTTRPASASAG
jgi:DNA-binding response OmpR family regulator